MKKFSILLTFFSMLISSIGYAAVIKESKLNEDVKIIVNDGGVFKDALTIDGDTADVSFLNPPKVGVFDMVHIVASGDSTGASVIAGPVTSCTSPAAPSIIAIKWVKLSNGEMYAYGELNIVTNQNSGCGVSAELTLPQSFNGNFAVTCSAGTQNNSITGPSGFQRCMIAHEKGVSPFNSKVRFVTTHEGAWAAGNLQQVRIYFQARGVY